MAFQRMYRIDLETLYPGDTSKFHFVIVLELDTHLLEKNRTSVVVCESILSDQLKIKWSCAVSNVNAALFPPFMCLNVKSSFEEESTVSMYLRPVVLLVLEFHHVS
ncbi:hypothetical protein JHK85_050269 [Glycine max]|nr:hypothetical protein JHK85_050269 [Glycine max]